MDRGERRHGAGTRWAFAACIGEIESDLNSNGKLLVYRFISPVLISACPFLFGVTGGKCGVTEPAQD